MEDQSYPRVKKFFFLFIFILSFSKANSENFKFIKIANLNNPWGSSFLNNDEMPPYVSLQSILGYMPKVGAGLYMPC